MTKIIFSTLVFVPLLTFGKLECDFYINQELISKKIGKLESLDVNYNLRKLTDAKTKEYQNGGYDTLTAYPEGSDPFGEDGYKEIPLDHQISITPKNIKSASFSEIRIFVQKINGKNVVAGYSVIGDTAHPLEKSRVFLLDTKKCKVRLAHNYYKESVIIKTTGTSRGWAKVNLKVCEKMKSKISAINSLTGDEQSKVFRSVVPVPAVTEDDAVAIKEAVLLCEYLTPGINISKKSNESTLHRSAQ